MITRWPHGLEGRGVMPKYLVIANYTQEGVSGLLSEGGSARRDAVEKLTASLGGSLECFHFAFGADDAFVIVDLPDNETAASVALAVGATGKVKVRTIPLLTPEQIDAASKKSPDYRPPGG
jgi:uncharacterized protein with GYD domain